MRQLATLVLLLAAPWPLAAQAPPAWVQQGSDPDAYPGARYLTGYGLSSPGASPAEQRRQALAMAQEALAASIRTRVTSEFISKVTQQNQQMSRFAQNLIHTKAEVELDGLEPFLVWTEPQGLVTHALAVLDKARTLQLLGDKLRRQAQECGSAFLRAKALGEAKGLLQARQLRASLEEGLVVQAVLGGPGAAPACPTLAEFDRELRQVYARGEGLDSFVATAALELGAALPRGIRVFMDRVTYADTPFCGSLSAYLEQTLASDLIACGQVKIVDKAAGRDALLAGGLEGTLPQALHAQAVVRGTCFELGEEVQLALRATATGGEELAAATVKLPAALLRKAGLKLKPDNFEEARKALSICDAQVQASRLQVKLKLDRGEGGIYRQGDQLHLFLKANLDCYVKVIYQQMDGTKVLIFPNQFHPDSRIQKDRLYQVPPDNNTFNLEVQAPFGAEMVKVIASTAPIELDGKPAEVNGFMVIKEELQGILLRTRGIALKQAQAQYAEATAVLNTMAAARP